MTRFWLPSIDQYTKMAKFSQSLKEKSNKVVPDISKKKSSDPKLEEFLEVQGRDIPVLLAACVEFIEAQGLDTLGIYWVSGELSDKDQINLQQVSRECSTFRSFRNEYPGDKCGCDT